MAPCQCSVCGGPVAPGSDLERLDLFDLRVAGGHLAASAVQRLRPLRPDTSQRLCSNCATVLARQQRLLTRQLLAEAETELDVWMAGLVPDTAVMVPDAAVMVPDTAVMVPEAAGLVPEAAVMVPEAARKPACAAVRVGDGSEGAAQGGVAGQAANQVDSMTGSSQALPNGMVESSQARLNGMANSLLTRPNGMVEDSQARPIGMANSLLARPNGMVEDSQTLPNGMANSLLARPNGMAEDSQTRPIGMETETDVVDSPVVKMKGVPVMAVIQSDAETGCAVVTLRGVADSYVGRSATMVSPVAPAVPWHKEIVAVEDSSDAMTGARSDSVAGPGGVLSEGPAGARSEGPAGCHCQSLCARCLAARAAVDTAIGLERHLTAMVSAVARRTKDTRTNLPTQENISTGPSDVLQCREHGAEACQVCETTVAPSRGGELHLPDVKLGRRDCPLCPKCSVCDASGAAKVTAQQTTVRGPQHSKGHSTANNSVRKSSQSTRFRCAVCGIYLQNVIILLRHFELHPAGECFHPGKSCAAASAYVKNGSGLKCSKSNRFRCAICDVSLEDMVRLVRHLERHYVKSYTRQESLEKPRTVLASCDADVVPISVSPSPTPSSPTPSSHTNANEQTREKSFACSMCERKFETGLQLQLHQVVHAVPGPFFCKRCPYKGMTKSALYNHERRHAIRDEKQLVTNVTPAKSFVCTACHVAMKDHYTLLRHRSKCEARKFSCVYCEKRFSSVSAMKRHMAVHTGAASRPRPCCCHLCPASYRDMHGLKKHVACHNPDTDEQCSLCPARFVRDHGSVVAHMRSVHMEHISAAPAVVGHPRLEL